MNIGEHMQTRLMSFNVRINVSVDGKHAWDYRKPHIFDFLCKDSPDLIGFQEVSPSMLSELKEALPMYHAFGIGRDHRGEGTPVFIKKNRFQVIDSGTFWLSETPHTESTLKGSHFPRIATYVVFDDINQHRFLLFNTHLDYAGDDIALAQAKILYQKMIELQVKYGGSLLLTGDFNVDPESKTVRFLTSKLSSVYENKANITLTFHGFSNATQGLPIDYIMTTSDIDVQSFSVIHYPLTEQYLSDHYPITIDFEIIEGLKP
jgi:endonuclease/exonuclease/phosphatase family metal-dependent hydrolase